MRRCHGWQAVHVPCSLRGMCHEAFTDARTPLPSRWLNRDGLLGYVCRQDYFKSLHYSSDETHAGKVLVFGLPTCAQHPHTEEWTQKNVDINAPLSKDHEQRKASVRGVVNRKFFFIMSTYSAALCRTHIINLNINSELSNQCGCIFL